ncbi:hypothetical protein RFI_09158 [Reticulomyxa filosa]|uniref:Uncharacterized protein n=1 Tax=Reticulomyxa filosa TaxID=46433 RepID=X6NPY2_RETFI|nr:hypothetical protein RFI_09158 [Reticulomyxa filosa]|eukprot:ETO27973.1 hypothetical protein RFI_09158 [Reticulomyxa filosa]
MLAFKLHIPRIIEFVKKESDEILQLKALQTLALISSEPQLHEVLFRYNILDLMVQFFEKSQEMEMWEASLVVLNQICFEWKDDFTEKKVILQKFWQKRENLELLCKCANIEDGAISIIANIFSLLATISSINTSWNCLFCVCN